MMIQRSLRGGLQQQQRRHNRCSSTPRSVSRQPRRASPAAAAAAAAAAGNHTSSSTSSIQQQPCVCGVVIVDHGSRRAASNDMLLEFCALYQQLTQQPIVEPAHMELAEPTIAQAVGRCVAAGARRVIIAPYFLSRGRHIQADIPALVAEAQQQHPDVPCSVAEPIGIDPLMVQIIHSRVTATLQDCPGTAAGTCEAAAAAAAAVPFTTAVRQ